MAEYTEMTQRNTGYIVPETDWNYVVDNFSVLKDEMIDLLMENGEGAVAITSATYTFFSTTVAKFRAWAFSDSADEGALWSFRLPTVFDPTQTPHLRGLYYMNSSNTSKSVVLSARISSLAEGDLSASSASFGAANQITEAVPDATFTVGAFDITLASHDSMAAWSHARLELSRVGTDASDDASGSLFLFSLGIHHELGQTPAA